MSRKMLYLRTLTALILLAAAAAPAQAYIYAGKRKKINCGVLMVKDVSGVYKNAALMKSGLTGGVADLFYLLDQRTDLKPAGWSLENPLAPGSPSQGLGKNTVGYWIVDLGLYRDLSRMDVLYLPASSDVRLSALDREKLRQFVDSGGVLWIDNASGSARLNFRDTFFITDFEFGSAGSGFDVPANRHHPLLSLPYWLSEPEIASLGMAADPSWARCDCKPGYNPQGLGWVDYMTQPTNFDVLYPIVNTTGTNGRPSVAANAYGSGRIVATSNYVGRGCFISYPFNAPSLKFAYNVIAWSASWTHLRKDPRHSGRSIDTVGGTKLLESWSLEAPPNTRVPTAPVIYKNVAFYSAGSSIFALDIAPQEDLDGDGFWNDGARTGNPPGYTDPPGKGLDVIWIWDDPDGGTLSSPTLVTAQDCASPNESIETVLVMSSSGKVYMLEAFPHSGSVLLPETNARVTWDVGRQVSTPHPPAYLNGWIYATANDGCMHAYNPCLEAWATEKHVTVQSRWQIASPGSGFSSTTKGGPTLGFIKNESSGAVVGMLYWYGGSWTGNPQQNDWIRGAPVFVSNDRLRIERSSSTARLYECRMTFRGAMSTIPAPVVQIEGVPGITVDEVYPNKRLDASASAVSGTEFAPEWLVIRTNLPLPQNAVIYGTYGIDYAVVGRMWTNAPIERWLEPSSVAGTGMPIPTTTIYGVPAMGPDNMIYLTGSRTGSVGDSIYGIKNDGSAQSTRWNYHLHGLINPMNISAGSPVPVPAVVFDEQTGEGLMEPKVYSSPAVAGGKVFVTVSGSSTSTATPGAALLCFKANPDFTIRITENAGYDSNGLPIRRAKKLIRTTTGTDMSVKIWQPDLMMTGSQPPPPMGASDVYRGVGMVDTQHGTITFENFDRPKVRGQMGIVETNTFTPSLPVWVYLDNIEVPIDWNTWYPAKVWANATHTALPSTPGDAVDLSGWNNLLWYYIVPNHGDQACSGIHFSPVIIGNTVYFVCDDGYMFALPTDSGGNTGGQYKDKPIWTCRVSPGGGGAEMDMSVAGSNGVLLVPASDGLHAYTNSTTLVADSNRVAEVDSAGELTWSVDTMSWPASMPNLRLPPSDVRSKPPRRTGPVNKPARAKYVGPGEILVVNTGANQICKIDKGGTVGYEAIANTGKCIRYVWDEFADPKRLLRPGQSTKLSAPTDAIYWRGFENGALVIHCLVADSGNHRIVDLVYRVGYTGGNPSALLSFSDPVEPPDPSSGYYLPELNWVTKTESMNERYVFESLQLVPERPMEGQNQDVWAAVSNYRTGTSDPAAVQKQGLGGAVVAIRYRVPTGEALGAWNYAANDSGQIVAACDRTNWGTGTASDERPLANPRYFQVVDRSGNGYLLICDNYGVYEAGPLGSGVPSVIRHITDEGYRALARPVIRDCDGGIEDTDRPVLVPLMAACVQELPNGNWLITNNYAGTSTDTTRAFSGEVLEVSWDQSSGSWIPTIPWSSPSIVWQCAYDPNLVVVGVVNDSWKQKMEKSYSLQQPRSAYRQF